MLPAPRILAIDDEPKHLEGLAQGLNRYGAACLQIHFTGDVTGIKPCPHVRVIFADLHLSEGGAGGDHARHFTVIGGLLQETITPTGPYIIVLWTKFADQADALSKFLAERLQGIPKPFAVVALDKMKHLKPDGEVKNVVELVKAIAAILQKQPQIAALLNWEEQVLGAAGDTVSAIVGLTANAASPADRAAELSRLLAWLAVEAVGEEHVEGNRFHAVNEALLSILADRIATLPALGADEENWKAAFSVANISGGLSSAEAAKLNRFVHIAEPGAEVKGVTRGAVIPLPDIMEKAFENYFGMKSVDAAGQQFHCRGYVDGDARFRWLLVQAQAACDFAQTQPGPLPFYLGLEMLESCKSKKGSPPQALWSSPSFVSGNDVRALHVNFRFQVSLTEKAAAAIVPVYRLREQLLNDLVFRIHAYGARPGITSFREQKAKPAPPPVAGPPAKRWHAGFSIQWSTR